MRIGSHYRSPACRLLLAVLALVYTGALSGGLVLHMEEEGAELRTHALATAGTHSGQPAPPGHEVPDDLECLLCQVLAAPGHPGAEPPAVSPSFADEALSPRSVALAPDRLHRTRQARAPPIA